MSKIVFATVAIGKDRKDDLLHLLNDIRNLNQTIYVLTDIEIDLKYYQFNNVVLIKGSEEWTCFKKFSLIKHIFETTEYDYVYYLDCDTRFFDFREEKFDYQLFEKTIQSINFDLLYSWGLGDTVNIQYHLRPPMEKENKNIRNHTRGHKKILSYLQDKLPNYEEVIKKETILEGTLVFKKTDNILRYLDELIYFGELLRLEDEAIGRKHKANGSGFALALFADFYNINLVKDYIVCHFFKANFLKEVMLWGMNMSVKEKVLKS
jgi:hypothetical protein